MPDIRFASAPYERCKSDFIAFRNKNRDSVRDESYFEWRFLKRPSSIKPLIIWAENEKSEKIGSLSLVPHDYIIDNRIYPFGILGDISVLKEWRGRGIARQMFEYLAGLDTAKGLKACVVLPNDEATRPLEKADWIKVSKIERYVKILDSEETLRRVFRKKAVSRIISPALNTLLRLSYNEVLLGNEPGYKGEVAAGFDGRFDELWEAFNKGNIAMGVRNRAYLTWRYSLHPLVRFKVFTLLYSGKVRGYIVFNTADDISYVYDILCINEKRHPDYLIYHFIDHIRRNRVASSIHIRVNSSESMSLPLKKFGFIRRPDSQRFMIRTSAGDSGIVTDGKRWFLTAGDKDV